MGYSKQVYDRAWMTLDRRAADARTRSAARKREIAERVPAIPEIEREMAVGAAGITKAVITAPDRAAQLIEQLAEQNLALQQKREELLRSHGYPSDYLAEQFGCADCRDQGYIQQTMCHCLRELLEQEAYTALSSAAPVDTCSFSTFSLDLYPDRPDSSGISPRARMSEVFAYCKRYTQDFSPERSKSLLLLGATGLGKTHLSVAIAAGVTAKGFGVVYTPIQKLMDTLEASKFSYDSDRKDQYAEHLRLTQTCDLLVLDDLGTEFSTQFSTSTLYNIINTRQTEGRPTIISTNLDLHEIEQKYSQRMISRLVCAYQVLKFAGKDIRFLRKAQSRPQK